MKGDFQVYHKKISKLGILYSIGLGVIIGTILSIALYYGYEYMPETTRVSILNSYDTIFTRVLDTVNVFKYDKEDYIEFHDTIKSIKSVDNIIEYLATIEYRTDTIDYANMPIITHKLKYGDCDDYARLSQYVLNFYGYDAYLLYMWNKKPGHAICIFENKDEVGVVDINNMITMTKRNKGLKKLIDYCLRAYGYDIYVLRDINYNIVEKDVLNE